MRIDILKIAQRIKERPVPKYEDMDDDERKAKARALRDELMKKTGAK